MICNIINLLIQLIHVIIYLVIGMSKIMVVGGGAAGMVAAILASKKNNDVTIIERNNVAGKKILVTGNGRCNYWNSDQDIMHYHSSNSEFLSKVINKNNEDAVLRFFDLIGIIPKIKDGYYYPYSNLAASMQYALLKECEVNHVKFLYNTLVTKIEKKESQFIINDSMYCDKVILATGSKACPKTGSDGSGYDLAKMLGHTIIDVHPSLVQLRGNESYFKLWNGIRVNASVSIYVDKQFVKKEIGELQLTDYGISGICVFNLSRYASIGLSNNKCVDVMINFVPWFQEKSLVEWLCIRNGNMKNRNIYELLEGFLNYKLVAVILKKSCIDKDKKWHELTEKEKNHLVSNIQAFTLNIIATNSFDKAQVCSGGVSLNEINVETMESKIVDNLYIIGELLDVDGDCGGYNLGFAWMSGMIAGDFVGHD